MTAINTFIDNTGQFVTTHHTVFQDEVNEKIDTINIRIEEMPHYILLFV